MPQDATCRGHFRQVDPPFRILESATGKISNTLAIKRLSQRRMLRGSPSFFLDIVAFLSIYDRFVDYREPAGCASWLLFCVRCVSSCSGSFCARRNSPLDAFGSSAGSSWSGDLGPMQEEASLFGVLGDVGHDGHGNGGTENRQASDEGVGEVPLISVLFLWR